MARPKSFNEEDVLHALMRVFWKQGYEATSMKDLEQASALSTGSLYNEFGNKHSLFIRVLKHYIKTVIDMRISTYLTKESQILEGIRGFLTSAYRNVPQVFQQQSCLLVNSAAELGQTDAQIGRLVKQGLAKVEHALITALSAAQQSGELPPTVNCQKAGMQLSMLMPGLLIASKNNQIGENLDLVVDYSLKQLSFNGDTQLSQGDKND